MPITSEIPIHPVSRETFDKVDAAVMRCAYESQNHFGRLCEEEVYENDLRARLHASGFDDVHTQVELMVSHEGFHKTYRLDLVVNQVLYELKATNALTAEHEAQALNYAALLGLNRVKLINFGAPKVQGKLLGTPFGNIDRRNVQIDTSRWEPVSEKCKNLAGWFAEFVRNIGGYLDTQIYEEGIMWFCGGEDVCLRRLPVRRGSQEMGKHSCRLYSDDRAFVVTGFQPGNARTNYHRQLQSLVSALPIQVFQWINIHHLDVSLVTVRDNRSEV